MENVTLSAIEGRIIGFLYDEDEKFAELTVKDENGKNHTVKVDWADDMPIPSGKVSIVQQIQFEGAAASGGRGGRGSGKPNVNFLFGKNGQILIDSETDEPFPARTGPAGRGDAASKRLEKARKENDGEPLPAQTRKFKDQFLAQYNGKSDMEQVKDWNRKH